LSIIAQPFFNREQGVSSDPDGARLAWRWFIQRRRSIIARLRLALDSDVWHFFPLGKKGAYEIYERFVTPLWCTFGLTHPIHEHDLHKQLPPVGMSRYRIASKQKGVASVE